MGLYVNVFKNVNLSAKSVFTVLVNFVAIKPNILTFLLPLSFLHHLSSISSWSGVFRLPICVFVLVKMVSTSGGVPLAHYCSVWLYLSRLCKLQPPEFFIELNSSVFSLLADIITLFHSGHLNTEVTNKIDYGCIEFWYDIVHTGSLVNLNGTLSTLIRHLWSYSKSKAVCNGVPYLLPIFTFHHFIKVSQVWNCLLCTTVTSKMSTMEQKEAACMPAYFLWPP